MKKIILGFVLFLMSGFVFGKIVPKVDVIIYYDSVVDSSYFRKVFNDEDICAKFDIMYIKSSEPKMVLLNSQSKKIIGTIYGTPSPKFLSDLYCNMFRDSEEIIADKK